MIDLDTLTRAVPLIGAFEPDAAATLLREGRIVRMASGTVLFRPGDQCTAFTLVLTGSVRVQLVTEGGHEIVLYRVEPGASCVLTTACLVAAQAYAAEGIAETEVDAVVLPLASFESLLGRSAAFRRMVFATFGARLQELVALISEVAFRRMDARLADWLLAAGADRVTATHREIAIELGTAREVVSRLLKEFERAGILELGRGELTVVDRTRLQCLADQLA